MTAPGRFLGVRHALRCCWSGSGPLKRLTDRIEVVLRVLVVVGVLVAVPLGMAVGTAAHARLETAANQSRATLSRVSATLSQDPPVSAQDAGRAVVVTEATWPAPDGGSVSGTVLASIDAQAGAQVVVWVAADGRQHAAPLSRWDVAVQGVVLGALVALGTALASVVLFAAGLLGLDRVRARRWTAAWAAVEPAWRAGRR